MKTHDAVLKFALTGFALALLTSCGSRGAIQTPGARGAQTTDPPTLTITAAPEEEEELEDAAFVIEGQVNAPGGLHETEPLTLKIENLETGVIDEFSFAGCVTANASLMTNSFFNETTGEFKIDAADDFALGPGPIQISLTGRDLEDRTESWDVTVEALEHWTFSRAAAADSRAAWEGRLLAALDAYHELLGEMDFESPYAANVDVDRDMLAALMTFLSERIADPDGSDFAQMGYDLEDGVDALLDAAGISALTEYGAAARDATSWERSFAETDQATHSFMLFTVGRAEKEIPSTVVEQAFCDHTFVDVDGQVYGSGPGQITPPETGLLGEFHVRIYQDVGAPNGSFSFPEDWDPGDVEADTADPNVALHWLTIKFWDTDEDDLVDDVWWGGADVVPETSTPPIMSTETITETDDYGHLLPPIMPFWMSRHHFRVAI